MAKFNIYSSTGVLKGVGYPTYTGTYMKPGVLEFREIASPAPIEWAIGDYVGYVDNNTIVPAYPRTGLKYSLYKIPQVKRQARQNTYGGAMLYQNVQFHDASFLLTIIPFRDLVANDNRVHFSTQPTISVYTNVSGIAEKIQACLDLDHSGEWYIRLATVAMGASQDVVDLMAEYRNFSVSGVTLQGVLEKVYEVWPEIGWTFSYEQINGTYKNVVTIGGAGLNLSTAQAYLYGKGNGLTSITRTVANADELANRIYAYGSSRNMMSGWYRSKSIKDAQSVDIEHLMLPIDAVGTPGTTGYYPGWGKTNNLPDPAKAFVEDSDSISERGLREKFVYFDGTGDTEEIYPTIRNMTIADVRAAVGQNAQYYPDLTSYPDGTLRVDRVKSVITTFDSGLAAAPGKEAILTDYAELTRDTPISLLANESDTGAIKIMTTSIIVPESGILDLSTTFDFTGRITASDVSVSAWLEVLDNNGARIGKVDIEVVQDNSYFNFNRVSLVRSGYGFSADDVVTLNVYVKIRADEVSQTARSFPTAIVATTSTYLSRYRAKTFYICINQIGFDIAEQAALGDGKTIHFRTGKCAGRTFTIKGCNYQSNTDTWLLEIIRSEDESLSQWFPNYDYPVRGKESNYDGDEFVLLDIAMPDSYIEVAERRLLGAAQEYLDWSKKEVWQYTPEIDAKFMLESNRAIYPADYMILFDTNVVQSDDLSNLTYLKENNNVYYLTSLGEKILLSGSGYADAVLVDSITINEGESTIPTYKVTLRERKRKTVSESGEIEDAKSNPVDTAKKVTTIGSTSRSDYWEEDGNGGIKLKDEYLGVWSRGYGSFGGRNPGSGGSGANLESVWLSLNNNTDAYANVKIHASHLVTTDTSEQHGLIIGSGLSYNPTTHTLSASGGGTGTVTGIKIGSSGTAINPDSNGIVTIPNYEFGNEGSGYVPITIGNTTKNVVLNSALNGYLPLTGGNMSGDITFNHNKGVYFKNSGGTTVNGIVLYNNVLTIGSANQQSSIYGTTLELHYGSNGYLGLKMNNDGRITIGRTTNSESQYLEWDETNKAWHIAGNLYVDGFLTSGGIGSTNTQLVTLSAAQTITGAKTFSGVTTFGGDVSISDLSELTLQTIAPYSSYINLAPSSGYVTVGGTTSSTSYKLYVNGACYATSFDNSSDLRLKKDIKSITEPKALSVLMRLKPMEWTWNEKTNLDGKRCAGLIAQDVEPVLPFAVSGGDYYSLNYNVLHAYEISVLQSHEKRILELERENKLLKEKLKLTA